MNRRRRNKILSLKDEVVNWTHDQEVIKDMVLTYFIGIYTTDHTHTALYGIQTVFGFNTLSDDASLSLREQLRPSEITNALYSFKESKAPRPDGLHPIFY